MPAKQASTRGKKRRQRTKSKRPPKGWIRACIAGVSKIRKGARRAANRLKSRVRNPGAVCGALWYHKMTPAERKAAKRRHPN